MSGTPRPADEGALGADEGALGPEATFEQLVEALEAITARMAAGDIGIEEVADLYEQAGRLHAQATERLEQVRRRVDRLTEAPPEG